MAGLNHDFLLLDRDVDGEWDLLAFVNDRRALHLHDDVLRYMADTLAWIPTYNPARREQHRGLCWYGPTIIGVDGAETAERVFRGWADLFAAGPSVLMLTGSFGWTVAGDPDHPSLAEQQRGAYERLEFDRDSLVALLRQLAGYAAEVRAATGRLYLLHDGI